MFVQSVTKQTGKIKIKNQGWVKTQAGVQQLIKAGILEVEIDPDKTIVAQSPPVATETVKVVPPKHRDPWHTTHSVEKRWIKR